MPVSISKRNENSKLSIPHSNFRILSSLRGYFLKYFENFRTYFEIFRNLFRSWYHIGRIADSFTYLLFIVSIKYKCLCLFITNLFMYKLCYTMYLFRLGSLQTPWSPSVYIKEQSPTLDADLRGDP